MYLSYSEKTGRILSTEVHRAFISSASDGPPKSASSTSAGTVEMAAPHMMSLDDDDVGAGGGVERGVHSRKWGNFRDVFT